MIRRTLINRALRQRDLVRTLIARHPLAAQDQRQPRLVDRPAAYIDDASWPAQAPIAAALTDYNAAPPEPETMAEWPADLPAFINIDNRVEQPNADASAAIALANSVDMPEDTPAPPAAAIDQRPNATLADLVHRMRDPGWVPPVAASPATAQTPPAPMPSGSIADLIRRMRAPDWVPPEAASPETTQLPPSNPQADLVRRMREPAAVSPEQSPSATTSQPSATPEQTDNERIADIVRQMWPAPQRSAGQRNRPRVPMGQRMAEAADFGQTPATPQHVAPREEQSVAPAIEIAHEEPEIEIAAPSVGTREPAIEIAAPSVGTREPAADRPPAGTEASLASAQARLGLPMIDRLPATEIAPEQFPAIGRSGDVVAPAPAEYLTPPLRRHPSPSAPGEGEISLSNASLPPEAPRTPSQQAEINAALSRASAISPSQAPAAVTTPEPISAPPLQNMDSSPDVPLHSASTRADSLTPPLPWLPSPNAPGEGRIMPSAPAAAGEGLEGRASDLTLTQQTSVPSSQLPTPTLGTGEPTLTQQPPTPNSQFPTPTLGTGEPTLTQSAAAALAAAVQVAAPTALDRPTTTSTTEPSVQASQEIRVPPAAATDLPRALADRAPVPVVAAPPADHMQTNTEPTRQIASESQRLPSEANTLAAPTQAADLSASHSAKTQISASETAQESQPTSFQKPESDAPQIPSLLPPEHPTQTAARPGLPISDASAEPAAVRKPESGAPQLPSSLPIDRPAQATAHPGLPISDASVQPATDGQSISAARTPQIERIDAPQGRSESAPIAPERGSPQEWAARLSPAEPPLPARIADIASDVSEPIAVQQPVSEPSSPSTAQLDISISSPDSSVRQPIAAPDRVMPADDRTGQAAPVQSPAAHQHMPAAEARVSPSAPVQPEQMPALNQQPRSTQSADSAARSAVSPADQPVASQPFETPLVYSNDMAQRSNALPTTNDDREIATARASETTAAIPIQEPHSALPSPDPRSPIVRDVPAAAADVSAAAAEPGTPAAWAARFARHRDLTEPQVEPTVVRAPTTPIGHTMDATVTPANADAAVAPEPGSPQAWAARFARHRDLTEPQPEPLVTPALAAPIAQPMDAPATPANADAATAPEPGSPAAWAARFARHRDLTEPQAEPIVAPAPAVLPAEQAPIAPVELSALPAAPARLVPAIVEPARGAPTRFVPARRAESQAAAAVPADTRTAATARSADARAASTAATEAPAPGSPTAPIAQPTDAAVAPEPGSPAAWAARFARHRNLTEPQPEPTAVRAPATPIAPLTDAAEAPAPGTPAVWAARFARHRNLTESQPEPTAVRAPAMPSQTETPADSDLAPTPEPGSPQAWAARFARHRDLNEPQAASNVARVPATRFDQPTQLPNASQPPAPAQQQMPASRPNAGQPATPTQRNRAPDSAAQAALRRATPTPIAETTRRFLTPLVGIDPGEVRVFRGPLAEQVTAAYKAEALASGDTVAMSAQHSEDTPAALGVLAHELTHIARQRDARFVPPLAQRTSTATGVGADEETLAQSVETQVQQIARRRVDAARPTPQPRAPDRQAMADTTPALPGPPAPPAAQPAAPSADWGGLPAPWEPLPQWIAAPHAAQPVPPVAARSVGPAQPAATPQSQRASAPAAARATAPVQLAVESRSLEAQPAQSAPEPVQGQAPEPDLDALARQVYAVLKQRLAAERRRSQS